MKLNELNIPAGAKARPNKRRGRGKATGVGGTCGRGHKGQNCRSGGGVRRGFEGGQMPLNRRLPKKGFHRPHTEMVEVVNLADIEKKGLEGEITPELLKSSGLVRTSQAKIKILGNGELSKAVTVRAHAFSGSAKEKIANAGGTAELL